MDRSSDPAKPAKLGVRVVISKGWNHANLAVLSLIAHGWGVRNAQDHSPTQTWTRVLPVQRPYISRSHANNQNNTRNARAPHSEGTANNDAHHREHLSKNVSEPPKIMHSSPGHHERSHQTCTVAHDKEQPDSALWAGHSAASHSMRPSQTMTSPAQTPIKGPAPLQLQVVLERGSGELSLWTRNGAKHAQHGSHGDLGATSG